MKFLMAGLGFWGQTWVKIISNHPNAELVAVVDPSEAAAVWAAKNLDQPLFSTFSEAQCQIKFDAVLIVTPPNRHASVAIEALAHGFHVLLEKPIASTREDAMAIESAAAKSTGYAMIAQGYRFLDGPRKIRELLQSETIGDLTSVRIHFRQCLPALFGTRLDHPLYALNHSILIDMCVHHIDLVRYITQQEIGKTLAFEYQTAENTLQYPSNAVCVFSLTDGTEVLWDGDWCVFENLTCWEGEWELIGKEARLFWRGDLEGGNYRSSLWIQSPRKPRVPINFTESVVDRRTPLLEHFIDAIGNGVQPQPSVSDNIRTFRTVLGCIDSIERKCEIRI